MFYELGTKELACDNQSASHLKSIQYFHKTKHLEVDSHKILTSNIKTLFVGSNDLILQTCLPSFYWVLG